MESINRSLGPVRDVLDTLAHEDGYRDRFDMFGSDNAQLMGALQTGNSSLLRRLFSVFPAPDVVLFIEVLDEAWRIVRPKIGQLSKEACDQPVER
jgi:hypothetical protein